MTTLAYACALALVHLMAGHFRILPLQPRSRWLSAAGGVAVAYVFVHILPELHAMQLTLKEKLRGLIRFIDSHIYLVSMAGLVAFYALERLAKKSRQRPRTTDEVGPPDTTSHGAFWVHVLSFAAYNVLIGYLLADRGGDALSTLLFALAMGVHFVTNDYALWSHHKHRYDRYGRWLLSAGILCGWGIGRAFQLPESAISLVFAFLSGGIILNVLKEELPEERESSVWAFALAALAYAAILLFE